MIGTSGEKKTREKDGNKKMDRKKVKKRERER